MSWEAWLTLGVVALTVVLLAAERLSAPTALLSAVIVLLVAGVISTEEAFSGFSNPAPLTVAALFVVAGAAQATGALSGATSVAFGRGGSPRTDLARIMFPTALASGLLNNTSLVAVVAPQIVDWGRATGRSASRYLMPMCHAVTLGGLLTLIGTSSNVVVSGLLEHAGEPGIGIFEITKVGVPVCLAGLAVMWLVGSVLLPERRASREGLREESREFILEMVVSEGSPLAGRNVAEGGLRNLEGVFLVEIERDGRLIGPVDPAEVIEEGDRLTFAGNVQQVLDLQNMPGLRSAESPHFDLGGRRGSLRFFEAVLGSDSPLVGTTLRSAGFRARYTAAVVAIHRSAGRVPAKLGRVSLKAGDVLLVLSDANFRERWRDRGDFLVIAPLEGMPRVSNPKAPLALLVVGGIAVLAASGLVPMLHAALIGAVVIVGMRLLTPREARDSVDLNVIVMIAASFGLGAAISISGLASEVAGLLVLLLGRFGDVGALAAVLVGTMLLTQLITNSAAAALMFPIAVATAQAAGLEIRPFAMAVAVGASSSFLTPIGYQTNTMVYGLGGYRFADFTRLGLPVAVVVGAVSLALIPLIWPLR